jgi:hypothetical protein
MGHGPDDQRAKRIQGQCKLDLAREMSPYLAMPGGSVAMLRVIEVEQSYFALPVTGFRSWGNSMRLRAN